VTSLDIIPAIMIGGAGSRLWPLSRANKPKQFLNLGGSASMFQNTLRRFIGPGFKAPWLLAGADTLSHVTTQLDELDLQCDGIVVEPVMRGTAAAIAALTLAFRDTDPDALLLVAPADHFIKDESAFCAAVLGAAPIAAAGSIVTFGITPTAPETGFGYIAGGEPVRSPGGDTLGYRIGPSGFHEKPALEAARAYVEQGYFWNAGIFLFKASVMLRELERHAPLTAIPVTAAMTFAERKLAGERRLLTPNAASFSTAPLDVPIDIAVMEKTDKAVVVPCAGIGWNDVGSLSALWEIADKDADGNAVQGDALLHNTHNVFVHSTSGRKTVLAHVRDLLVVDTEDALIVVPADQAQAVKTIVKQLKDIAAPQLRYRKEASFPWGNAHIDATSPEHMSLSLQLSPGRELRRDVAARETWVVTYGVATVEIDDKASALRTGFSVTVQAGQHMAITARDEDARFVVVATIIDEAPALEQLFAPAAAAIESDRQSIPQAFGRAVA
jgi:mannose-1-phosphate guanylyltransferase/mannose-6-phosphate isomerase